MRRFATLLICGLVTMFATFAHADTTTFNVALSGPNESPPNASPGNGTAVITVDTVLHQLKVSVTFGGLTAGTTAAHIHCCVAPNGVAGVATTTPTFAGFPLGVTSGTFSITLDTTQASSYNPAFITANGGTPLTAEAALFAGIAAGRSYLNIHTSAFPGGEIRGFLVAQAGPIPTLSEWALGILAVIVVIFGFVMMRKRAA